LPPEYGAVFTGLHKKALFKRFRQGRAGKRYTSGTGLGLYLSKQIVEGHQGTIICESKLGSGATFVIMLPASQREVAV